MLILEVGMTPYNSPFQPPSQRHNFSSSSFFSFDPSRPSYSAFPPSYNGSLSGRVGPLSPTFNPSIPSISPPGSFTPPPSLNSSSLQGRAGPSHPALSISPSWSPPSLHLATPQTRSEASPMLQPPCLSYPNLSLNIPS